MYVNIYVYRNIRVQRGLIACRGKACFTRGLVTCCLSLPLSLSLSLAPPSFTHKPNCTVAHVVWGLGVWVLGAGIRV